MDDSILFAACFDANGAVFEPLFGEQDAIVSDALNHASIIDGIRLSKAKRFRFANGDMNDLETQLKAARGGGARRVIIVTDGVFSMDGYFARLAQIRALADRFEALVMVDDCHATGFIGPQGRGTPHRAGVKVDILTGTLGKALGGSAGGYIAASRPIVDLMRQRARPYLFSNALPPPIVAASLKAIDLAEQGDGLRQRLSDNARRFRSGMSAAGFTLLPGEHPIIPVMLGEAKTGPGHGGEALPEGNLRHRLLLPRGAEGPGPHPHPDVGGPFLGRHRPRRSRPSPPSAGRSTSCKSSRHKSGRKFEPVCLAR